MLTDVNNVSNVNNVSIFFISDYLHLPIILDMFLLAIPLRLTYSNFLKIRGKEL